MDLDAIFLSRLQFAFTIAFHIIFPSFTIGLASFLAVLEGLWLARGREVYLRLYLFWLKIFAISFALGVVSGVVMSYQFGTNWSRFSAATGNVLGPLLGYEVLTAFFLEASFLGIMLFGWNKVGRGLHFVATLMVAIGTLVSAFWIIAANSWMQTPVGHELKDGVFYAVDWFAIVFNPSMPYRLVHMVLAAYITTGFVVAGVSAIELIRNRNQDTALCAMKMALGLLAILVPLQMIAGHEHGENVHKHQPAKLAAMEGHWETKPGQPLILFALPDEDAERNRAELSIPNLGSLAVTGSMTGVIHGLKEFPKDQRPPVAPVFWAFRVMVGIGILMLVMVIWGMAVWRRALLHRQRLFQLCCVLMIPSGFIAVIAGWMVAEIGRQPYTVYGLLRTADSVSPITADMVSMSLMVFVAAYTVVFGGGLFYIWKIIDHGPPDLDGGGKPRPGKPRPGPAAKAAPKRRGKTGKTAKTGKTQGQAA